MYDLMDFLKLSTLFYPQPDEENISSLKPSLLALCTHKSLPAPGLLSSLLTP